MYLLSKLKTHWDKLALVLILLLLCATNYTPHTFLIGWDNLLPEFNLGLNLKRSLFAVWQEYQGLGLVGGMAHATDLIRQIILIIPSLILPTSLIRYLWHFFLLFFGTFGVYFGLNKKFTKPIPFLASIFYLLNFGTIQYFWAPLESFSAFWAFFPWLIFSLWDYLDQPSRFKLYKLLTFNLLAIPAFYVQTLFLVYLICIFIVLFINHKSYIINLKILFLIFLINSFWLLPQLYFLKTNLQNPTAGIGNFMSSDESFARNQKRGYISDFLLLRGYYTDFPDSDGSFMAPWVSHLSNHYVLLVGYLLSTIVIIGLIACRRLDLWLLFLFSATALLSATPPFSYLNQLVRQFPLVNQIFRAPFTKFIVPAIFTFTLLSAYGLQALIHLASQLKYSKKYFSILLFTCYVLLITFYVFPTFKGNFINPKLRQSLPPEYQQLFNFFKTQSPPQLRGRIANLPQGSFWGWTNYRFGIRGSGFLWYGIANPILDRAFDAWNLRNEQYYWELTSAIQKRDSVLLDLIFKKYSIQYIIFDRNVYFPDEKIYAKQATPTLELLQSMSSLIQIAQFNQISVFQTPYSTQPYLISNPVSLKPTNFYYQDIPFQNHSDYISDPQSPTSYPYLGLFTNRLQSESKPLLESLNLPLDDNSFNTTKTHSDTNQNIFAWNFPTATFDQSYLVKIDYQHSSGLPLTVSANSEDRYFRFFSTRLEPKSGPNTAYFIIPQFEDFPFHSGLNIIFSNTSYNNSPNQNQVSDVSIFPFPYDQLASLETPPINQISSRTYLNFKSNIFYYQISLPADIPPNSYLVLPQTFDPGWLALGLKNHTLVNNWANAWEIPITNNAMPAGRQESQVTVYLIFWPQILEFMGLLLIPLTFFWFTRRSS